MRKTKKETCDDYLSCCLYFTAAALSRVVTRMAEEEFAATGLSPAYAFLLLLVIEKDGITQKELAERLALAPSTITRFIDKLERKRLVRRAGEGKLSRIRATEGGKKLEETIQRCWGGLYRRYSAILGQRRGDELTALLDGASRDLLEGL